MRLRQIALVAQDLEAACSHLEALLGLGQPYADPGVGKYGLRNAVYAVGDTFLEVVSPTRAGTTAGRLLDKRGGDGGYMVILQVEDLAAQRLRAEEAGARAVDRYDGEGVAFTHLHPKDVGGAILSIDHMEPAERWEWAGPDWRERRRTEVALGIAAAEVQAQDPGAVGRRWGEVLGLPATATPAGARLELDGGRIWFTPAVDGRGDGLGAIEVQVRDPAEVRRRAAALRLLGPDGELRVCGTRLVLTAADDGARGPAAAPGL